MALWTPAEITTALWLDAADSDTITTVSDAVSEWADKSGNSRHATQGTAARRPGYQSDAIGGKNALRFNGTDSRMLLETGRDLSSNTTAFSIYAVAKARIQQTANRPIFHISTSDTVSHAVVVQGVTFLSTKKVRAEGRKEASDAFASISSTGDYSTDSANIQAGVFDYVNGDLFIFLDGVSDVNESFYTGTTPVDDANYIRIGSNLAIEGDETSFFDGDIAEILCFRSVLSTTDRQKIEGYLAHKWGLEANLPNDHPYKLFAPGAITGELSASANLHGDPWLARVIAGRFGLDADLTATKFLGWFLDAGAFTGAADLSEPSFFYGVDGHLSLDADLHADPLRAYPMPRFVLGADLKTTGTYRGMFQTAGRFALEAEPHGDFHRIVWWQDPRPITSQQVYTCILTGHQDSTTDLALPMSSFQFRLYHHGGSYLSIVVPNAVLYAPQIAARLNGQLVVRQGYRQSDGTEQLAEMARAGQITLRHDTGARNSSATIVAGETVQFSFDAGVVKKVTKLINRTLQADGNWQFRTPPIFGLFPGDSVEVDGQSWNVIRVSVAVGRNLQTMDILSDGPS